MLYILGYLVLGMLIAGVSYGKISKSVAKNTFTGEELAKFKNRDFEPDSPEKEALNEKALGVFVSSLIFALALIFLYPFILPILLTSKINKRKKKKKASKSVPVHSGTPVYKPGESKPDCRVEGGVAFRPAVKPPEKEK